MELFSIMAQKLEHVRENLYESRAVCFICNTGVLSWLILKYLMLVPG